MSRSKWLSIIFAMMLVVSVFGYAANVASADNGITLSHGQKTPMKAGWSCAADLREVGKDGKMYDIMSEGSEVVEFYSDTDIYAEWGGYCAPMSAEKLAAQTSPKPDHVKMYFPQTHQSTMDTFLTAWRSYPFKFIGFPDSKPTTYVFAQYGAQTYTIQVFEKTVLVDHPNLKITDPNRVDVPAIGQMWWEMVNGKTANTNTTGCPEDHYVAAGEVYLAHKGCTAKGDVMVWNGPQTNTPPKDGPESKNWVRMYQECRPALNGNMVVFSQDTWVRLEGNWGANVDPHNYCQLLEVDMHQMGCGSHCDSVTTWYWPFKK